MRAGIQMRRHLVIATAAVALYGVQAALAGSQGYIVSNWAPAMNNVDDSGCPQGRNPGPREIMIASLKERGVLQKKSTSSLIRQMNEAYGRYMARRYKDGQAVRHVTH
jgi:hypothetical protein